MIKNSKNLSLSELEYRYAINEKKTMGQIFGFAPFLGILFDNDEIKYIETKMMTHKLYRALGGKMFGNQHAMTQHRYEATEIWLQSFLEDPELPLGVRAFIHYYIGAHRGNTKMSDEYAKTKRYTESMQHSFLTELWMEKCR
ncbi:MAG: hypothetical protein MJ164_03745 [Alphaproteobacteria bacterium]|nr:hypothetical protein [Alphaproteobacteria bacterium]